MPGLISDLFEPEESGSASQQTTTISGDGDTGLEASPSLGIGLSGTYEDADGTEHQWSNSTEVGTDIDLDAVIATTTELSGDTTTDFA